jgi:hypothetical protein
MTEESIGMTEEGIGMTEEGAGMTQEGTGMTDEANGTAVLDDGRFRPPAVIPGSAKRVPRDP